MDLDQVSPSRSIQPLHPVPGPSSSTFHSTRSVAGPSSTVPALSSARKKRKLNYVKCEFCRRDKQKCQPSDRQWPGQKCDRCIEKGFSCSEPVDKGKTVRTGSSAVILAPRCARPNVSVLSSKAVDPAPGTSPSRNSWPDSWPRSTIDLTTIEDEWKFCAEAEKCMLDMRDSLKRDMLNVEGQRVPLIEISRERINMHLPYMIQYACKSWTTLLEESKVSLAQHPQLRDRVYDFLRNSGLYWLEASLLDLGVYHDVLLCVETLEVLTRDCGCPQLEEFVDDFKNFICTNMHELQLCYFPMWLYSSALLYEPNTSSVWKAFGNELPSWIETLPSPKQDQRASAELLHCHSHPIKGLVFSPNGKQIASYSDSCDDPTVILWSTATGLSQHRLSGHKDAVYNVIFSATGELLVSVTRNGSLRLWETATGLCRHNLIGYSSYVESAVLARNEKLMASWSDNSVQLWDTSTGVCLATHSDAKGISGVALSPDSQMVAFLRGRRTLQLWSVTSHIRQLEKHDFVPEAICAMAFSPDSSMLAVLTKETLGLWNLHQGTFREIKDAPWVPTTLDAAPPQIVYSSDGKLLATISGHWLRPTVEVRDVAQGSLLQSVVFDLPIKLMSFSPNGASLNTNLGQVDIRHTNPYCAPNAKPCGIFISEIGNWIVDSRGRHIMELWDDVDDNRLVTVKDDTAVLKVSGSIRVVKVREGALA